MNPLNSISGAVTTGVVLAIIAFVIIPGAGFNELSLARWLHILSGVMWIGLLYYFNVVQTPAWPRRPPTRAAQAARASASTSRLARFSGSAGPLSRPGSPEPGTSRVAATSAAPSRSGSVATRESVPVTIGIGAWLGTIMLFNVWVLIWPNQKKILGIVPATDEQKAKARKIAGTPRASTSCSRSRC